MILSTTQNILAVQQMFMGYLSHEIRTPINSVYLGLTIVFNGLTTGVVNNQQTSSVVETVVDTRKACQSAVDILDNMILYDQIIRGLMTMDMNVFDPLKHTYDIVNKFRTEVHTVYTTYILHAYSIYIYKDKNNRM